jgi:hypothetical protein
MRGRRVILQGVRLDYKSTIRLRDFSWAAEGLPRFQLSVVMMLLRLGVASCGRLDVAVSTFPGITGSDVSATSSFRILFIISTPSSHLSILDERLMQHSRTLMPLYGFSDMGRVMNYLKHMMIVPHEHTVRLWRLLGLDLQSLTSACG